MNKILNEFGKARVFLPVIHPISFEVAHKSVQTAVEAGADGIFLINQGMDDQSVLELTHQVHNKYPNLWIGLNLLGNSFTELLGHLEKNPHIKGLWIDNGFINENSEEQLKAATFRELKQNSPWKGLYFGGVAFKGQRPVAFNDLAKAAAIGAQYMDVVTTSGLGTGIAADLSKIKEMRKGIDNGLLGIASGITPENITDYIYFIDAFLVATGIEKSFGVLDFDKTKKVATAIHNEMWREYDFSNANRRTE